MRTTPALSLILLLVGAGARSAEISAHLDALPATVALPPAATVLHPVLPEPGATAALPIAERDRILDRWNLPLHRIHVAGYFSEPVPGPVEERVYGVVAKVLRELPAFLVEGETRAIEWRHLDGYNAHRFASAEHFPGIGGGKVVVGEFSQTVELEQKVAHELAHVYFHHPKHEETVNAYLALRYQTPEVENAIQNLWGIASERTDLDPYMDVEPVRQVESQIQASKDDEIDRALRALGLPQHYAYDTHGIWEATEYWAYSVEFFHLYKRAGDLAGLTSHLCTKEIEFLSHLFEKPFPFPGVNHSKEAHTPPPGVWARLAKRLKLV
jgi:hypothetical protein